MSNLFNLPTDRAPQWDNMIKERYDLLEKSETDKKRLDELETELSGLSFGESEEEIKARKLIIDANQELKGSQMELSPASTGRELDANTFSSAFRRKAIDLLLLDEVITPVKLNYV